MTDSGSAPAPAPPDGADAGRTAEDVAKVAKVAQAFGGFASAKAPGVAEPMKVVVVGFSGKDVNEADVPELARQLAETQVPVAVRLRRDTKLSAAAYRQLFTIPNLREINADNENSLQAVKEHPGSERIERLILSGPTLTDLGVLTRFPNVRSLGVYSNSLTGPGVQPLGGLADLESLSLSAQNLTDADLAPLAKLRRLRSVYLFSPKFTTGALAHLAGATGLRSLPFGEGAPKPPYTDQTLSHLARLDKVEELYLNGPEVTDAGLKHLAGMTGLRAVTLKEMTKVTAEGMRVLAALPNLTSLKILRGKCPTAEAFAGLAGAPKLKELTCEPGSDGYLTTVGRLPAVEDLSVTNFYPDKDFPLTDAGLAGLKGATRLRKFSFSGPIPASNAGFADLAALGELTDLRLVGNSTSITDAGVTALAKLSKLQLLRLDGLPVTDAGVASLADLPDLRSLSLNATGVTSGVADVLARFPKLERVSIQSTKIDYNAVQIKVTFLTKGRVKLMPW